MWCNAMQRNENLCFRCAPDRFRQSNPKWTSPRVTFVKATRNGPRPGSLSPKLPEMDLAPGHFRQSSPKWTSPRVTLAKAVRNGPQKAFVIPRSLHSAGRSGKIQLSPQPAPLPFRWAKDYCLSRCACRRIRRSRGRGWTCRGSCCGSCRWWSRSSRGIRLCGRCR